MFSVVLLNCGGDEEEQPKSPIFSDVEIITLYTPDAIEISSADTSNFKFTFCLPSEVSYAVLGIFYSAVPIETNGNTFTNPDNLIAGSRTGLTGWGRGEVSASNLYEFDNIDDFNENKPFSLSGTYHWAVWGYDKWGNLTHASEQWEVIITY